jgi:FdhD protein
MVYNGISHAVMMATPSDLEDFAIGFSLTEGIVSSLNQIKSIDVNELEKGFELNIDITNEAFMYLKSRRRQLSGRSGCGLCGLESLEAVEPNINKPVHGPLPDFSSINKAFASLQKKQQLASKSGASHAAALVNLQGDILYLREDVGRHNALDKLLGAVASQTKEDCFVLVSSRASYEMVYKTYTQSIATLVSVSAPTSMAIELAQKAAMNLIGFVRANRQNIYTHFSS